MDRLAMEIGLPDKCPFCGSERLMANTDGIIYYSKAMVKEWFLRTAHPHEMDYNCHCYACEKNFTHPPKEKP